MKNTIGRSLRVAGIYVLVLGGCSGRGPDVIDPNSSQRTQAAVLSLAGADADELGIYREGEGLTTVQAWVGANGEPLGRRVDAIFEAFDRLYLLHRTSGSVTIADLATRRKVTELTGFPQSLDSGLIGMAFSNLSQGWAIAYASPVVYHIDLVNTVVVAELALPGNPTAVATSGNRVFVATERDGNATVSVFRSNQEGHPIERTLTLPAPVVFMSENGSGDALVVVTAGSASRAPSVHSLDLATMEQTGEKELSSAPLLSRIGQPAEFAAISRDDYLYVALDETLVRVSVRASRLPVSNWLRGTFRAVSAEYWSDLVYAVDEAGETVHRVASDGTELDPIDVPAPVRAMEFVNAIKLQQ